MLHNDFSRRGVPWVRLLLERGSSSSALNLGWRHRMSALAAGGLVVAAATGRRRVVVGACAALVVLNGSFYVLLLRRRGAAQAVVGVGLHALHHLAGGASVPAGIVAHALSRRRDATGRVR
jgi:hypothetical protein